MEKKYELIKEDSIEVDGHTLYRIKAVKDSYYVNKDELGGYVESEDNLSHDGECWIHDNSMVFGKAVVTGNGSVTDNAKVYDYAIIQDDAIVMDRSEVYGHAIMEDYSAIGEDAKLYGSAKMRDCSNLRGFAEVYDYVRLRSDCLVNGDARIYGNSVITGDACITDHASVKDNAVVSGRVLICGYATVSKHASVSGVGRIDFNVTGDNDVAIYTDPCNKGYYITASTKEDWFNSVNHSGKQEDFLKTAKGRSQEEFDKYAMISNLHLDLYGLRDK